MQRLSRVMIIFGALISTGTAYAGSTLGGYITSIQINTDQGSYAVFSTSAPKTQPSSSCATGTTWQWVLPLTTALDNQIYAMLLEAYATQAPVNIYGDDTCTTSTGIETAVQVNLATQ